MAKKKAKKTAKVSAKKSVKKVAKAAAPKKAAPTPPKNAKLSTPKNTNTKQYTQSELLDNIQQTCGFTTRREAREFYGRFSEMIQAALRSGFKLALPGLGKLQVRTTKPRMGINPMTREPIHIPSKRRIRFTPNKALKQAVL